MTTSRICKMFEIEVPIIQAPMAGAQDHKLAVEVSNSGGLGSIPCARYSAQDIKEAAQRFRAGSDRSLNLNFFCHEPVAGDLGREKKWRDALKPAYDEFGIEIETELSIPFTPFDAEKCAALLEAKPKVASFHFGLPAAELVAQIKAAGIKVIASATTLSEAKHLAQNGCDAIIAQGYEAGGHRGIFLSDDLSTQTGTFSLVQQVSSSVDIPVIAAGGIADGAAIKAALSLGAEAVQIGTRFLKTPESKIAEKHRQLLLSDEQPETAVTNVFSGRPARGFMNRVMREFGPMSKDAQQFPLASGALTPLIKASSNNGDFSSLWAGQSAHVGNEMPAADLLRTLAAEAAL